MSASGAFTADSSNTACYAYAGPQDPCALHNQNDIDFLNKNPSTCQNGVFYLWDEPNTQAERNGNFPDVGNFPHTMHGGAAANKAYAISTDSDGKYSKAYAWSAAAWVAYADKWEAELRTLRGNGLKITTPLVGGGAGDNGANWKKYLDEFFNTCNAFCAEKGEPANCCTDQSGSNTSKYKIDVIGLNAFCANHNRSDSCKAVTAEHEADICNLEACTDGARFVRRIMTPAAVNRGLKVHLTNWSFLKSQMAETQVHAMNAIPEFFREENGVSSPFETVYWFAAIDYCNSGSDRTGCTQGNLLTDTVGGGPEQGNTLGEVYQKVCQNAA